MGKHRNAAVKRIKEPSITPAAENLFAQIQERIKRAVDERPCCEMALAEDEWDTPKTGEYPIFDLLAGKTQ